MELLTLILKLNTKIWLMHLVVKVLKQKIKMIYIASASTSSEILKTRINFSSLMFEFSQAAQRNHKKILGLPETPLLPNYDCARHYNNTFELANYIMHFMQEEQLLDGVALINSISCPTQEDCEMEEDRE